MTRTILIVEDNAQNRLLLRDILIFHGYQVLEAENGDEGVRLAKTAKPDLMLLDIQMPVMDGITAATLLKNDPATVQVKLIALTSFAMKSDRERIMAAGFDDYITKPIDTRKLPLLIRRHLLTGKNHLNDANRCDRS